MRQWVNPKILLQNTRIEGFHVCLHYYASHAALLYLAGRRNESNKNHYPSDDAENVDDRSIPAWLVQASNLNKGKGYI